MFQNLGSRGNVHSFLSGHIPGQFQHRIQIIPQNSTLRRTEGLLFQPFYILHKLLLDVLGQMKLHDFRRVGIGLIKIVTFPKFFTNYTHLLAEIVLFLVLIDIDLGLFLNNGLDFQHFHFLTQQPYHRFKAAGGVQLA